MATVKVTDIIDRASRSIQDTSNVRWTKAELLDYFNDTNTHVVSIQMRNYSVGAGKDKVKITLGLHYSVITT